MCCMCQWHVPTQVRRDAMPRMPPGNAAQQPACSIRGKCGVYSMCHRDLPGYCGCSVHSLVDMPCGIRHGHRRLGKLGPPVRGMCCDVHLLANRQCRWMPAHRRRMSSWHVPGGIAYSSGRSHLSCLCHRALRHHRWEFDLQRVADLCCGPGPSKRWHCNCGSHVR
jgi:hypothetical protein